MSQTHTQAVEDYLKTIYKLQGEQSKTVSTNTLAERLEVAPASVTNMVKKLADMGLVVYKPYQGVVLSTTGKNIALRIIRYHRLVELYLVEKLGVPWDQVHALAEEWEHSLSEILAERIDIALDYPATDPHGSPIPTQTGDIARPNQLRLADLQPGQPATVTEVSDHNPELLRYLDDLALYPGVNVSVCKVMPLDGLLMISIGKTQQPIGLEVARHVFVGNLARQGRKKNQINWPERL